MGAESGIQARPSSRLIHESPQILNEDTEPVRKQTTTTSSPTNFTDGVLPTIPSAGSNRATYLLTVYRISFLDCPATIPTTRVAPVVECIVVPVVPVCKYNISSKTVILRKRK
jgi:hypothetical protein